MAKRLATEYVKTCLHLTEVEFNKLIQLFASHGVSFQVKVLENGTQEVVLEDKNEQEVVLTFERKATFFVTSNSCTIYAKTIANALREAIRMFKGSATVNRIFANFYMEYEYRHGKVYRIREVKCGKAQLVFERNDMVTQLEQLYAKREIELQIARIKEEINYYLDQRNSIKDQLKIMEIDRHLHMLAHSLFVFEA